MKTFDRLLRLVVAVAVPLCIIASIFIAYAGHYAHAAYVMTLAIFLMVNEPRGER